MKNAAIIRANARELEIQIKAATLLSNFREEDKDTVLAEIAKFRIFFIAWVKYFEKDDFEHEWALY